MIPFSNFGTYEIDSLVNDPRNYLRKYGISNQNQCMDLLESSDSEMLALFWFFVGQAQKNIGHVKRVSNINWPILMTFNCAFFNNFIQH